MRWFLLMIQLAGLFVVAYCAFIFVRAEAYQEYEERAFDRALVKGLPGSLPRSRYPMTWPFASGRIKPELRSKIGRIDIPRLQLSTMILEGDGRQELQLGAGHIPGTALPGNAGNVVIAAHRDTFFRPLRNIAIHDKIVLTTLSGSFQYIVDSVKLIDPADTQVLQASAGSSLTLVTCYPFYYVGPAPKRFVVHANEVSVRQMPPGQR